MRVAPFVPLLLLGCARAAPPEGGRLDRSEPDAAVAPATRAPSASGEPTSGPAGGAPSAEAWAPVTAGASGAHVCEPTVTCGVWSGCTWLRRLGSGRFLDESTKTVYVRRHVCAPRDGGPTRCALFCSAPDAGPPCVDGLHPEREACDESAPPRPATARCRLGDGVCGSLL